MFKTIDVLIGFTLVMLVVSLAVTVITQLFVGFLNLRGHALRDGITELLRLLDYGIDKRKARRIADHILRDPIIAPAGILPAVRQVAPVVHREELTKLLLAFGANQENYKQDARRYRDLVRDAASAIRAWAMKSGAAGPKTTTPWTKPSATALSQLRLAFAKSLADNGVANPDATLSEIRTRAMDLEKSAPRLSNSERVNIAILENAHSAFLGKLNGWFDQTIDRVSDAFTLHTRLIGAAVAVVVAFALQLDAIGVINKLSTDDALRLQTVKWAVEHQADLDQDVKQMAASGAPAVMSSVAATGPARAKPAGSAAASKPTPAGPVPPTPGQARRKFISDQLADNELVSVPKSYDDWKRRWDSADAGGEHGIIGHLGVVLSAILLSLGAPFWFDALKNLMRLRSVVATKDDEQRQQRQSNQPPTPIASDPATDEIVRG